MSLKEKTMIVQLNTSHWTARKYDAKVSQEIDESHDATKSGRFNKTLIISDLLNDVNTCVGKARSYHYKVTMPWDDAGQRLLPVAEYFEYTKKMEEFQIEHKKLVSIFMQEYPTMREAAKGRLNTLFNESDYPDEQALVRKFNISYKITPVADSSDLRIELSKDEVKEIKRNIENGLSEKINNAKNSIIERAEIAVRAMYKKLSDQTSTFRDTLVGNIVSIAEILPSMNFDNDDQLVKLQKKLSKLDVPPDSLRKDMKVREETAKTAKKLLKKIKGMRYGDALPEIVVPEKKVKTKKDKKSKKVKKTKRIR